MARQRHNLRKVITFLIGIGCMALLAFNSYSLVQTIQKRSIMLEQLAQVQVAHKQAVNTNREAQQEYQLVKDSEYLAQIARRDYYYSKKGEIIFDLEERETSQSETVN